MGFSLASEPAARAGEIRFVRRPPDILEAHLSGGWRMTDDLPALERALPSPTAEPGLRRLVFDTTGLTEWDSVLVAFVTDLIARARARQLEVDRSGLPDGVRRLLALAEAVPERTTTGRGVGPLSTLARIGVGAVHVWETARSMLAFLGEAALAFGRLFRGRANFRRQDLVEIIQECGPQALPIVGLISFLIGLILAFVGAVQLQQFGASIFVADLVAIATLREMGCMMTAIIMAGRTGAAFAAQLGTMKVNEEIDALTTMGISPMDFLVLPRMLALILMMPLLTLYANVVAIGAGALIGTSLLDLGLLPYLQETQKAMRLTDFLIGLVKGSVFGVLVAVSGCLRGMESGRSAAAVGLAATSAVVTAIVLIVVADGVFAVLLDAIGY